MYIVYSFIVYQLWKKKEQKEATSEEAKRAGKMFRTCAKHCLLKRFVWLYKLFLSSISTASKTRYSHTKWAKHQNARKVLKTFTVQGLKCMCLLAASFSFVPSLIFFVPFPSLSSSSYLPPFFLSFLPSFVASVFPSLKPAFLCWSVASILCCFAPSFRPTCSCLWFLLWHVAFKFFDIRIPHVGLMRGDKGDQDWPSWSVPLAIAPFRPERSSKALVDSPEPAMLCGTRGVLSCFGKCFFLETSCDDMARWILYTRAAARTFGSNRFYITNCLVVRV